MRRVLRKGRVFDFVPSYLNISLYITPLSLSLSLYIFDLSVGIFAKQLDHHTISWVLVHLGFSCFCSSISCQVRFHSSSSITRRARHFDLSLRTQWTTFLASSSKKALFLQTKLQLLFFECMIENSWGPLKILERHLSINITTAWNTFRMTPWRSHLLLQRE